MSESAIHDRFLRRVRRRWMVWRVIESAGVCAFGGAVVGLLLVPVLMWRGQEALGAALVLLGIGAAAGVVWGVTRRPTILRTAIEVDRQLALHDLLSTVIRKQTWGDEAFEQVVRAQAEAACQRISVNELILRRLGGRAWGGMGIAAALVVTMALMSGGPTASRAHEAAQPPVGLEALSAAGDDSRAGGMSVSRRDGASDVERGLASQDEFDDPDGRGEGRASVAREDMPRRDGAGSAQARSEDKVDARLKPAADAAQESSHAGESADSMVKPPPTDRATPPWRGDSWSTDREAAERDINTDRVPDRYRDLVREYFDRGEE